MCGVCADEGSAYTCLLRTWISLDVDRTIYTGNTAMSTSTTVVGKVSKLKPITY